MNWICPDCKAVFKHKNQWHSCVIISPEEVLSKSSALVKELYYELDNYIMDLGEVHRVPLLTCISYKSPATFITLKPKRDHLYLEVFLGYAEDVFPVEKLLKVSSSKWVHIIPVDDPEDIDSKLKGWIVDAFWHSQK